MPNSRFALHGLAPHQFTVCALLLPRIHGLGAFFRPLVYGGHSRVSELRQRCNSQVMRSRGSLRKAHHSCTRVRGPPVALHVSQQISSESWGSSGVPAVSRYTLNPKGPCRTCRP